MGARTMKILIDLGDELDVLHQVRGVALEDGLGADVPAVAFQVTLGAIGSNFLEVGAEGMASQPHEPVLEGGSLLGMKGQPEAVDIDGSLQFIHDAAHAPLARSV